jgi:hypothetical protein
MRPRTAPAEMALVSSSRFRAQGRAISTGVRLVLRGNMVLGLSLGEMQRSASWPNAHCQLDTQLRKYRDMHGSVRYRTYRDGSSSTRGIRWNALSDRRFRRPCGTGRLAIVQQSRIDSSGRWPYRRTRTSRAWGSPHLPTALQREHRVRCRCRSDLEIGIPTPEEARSRDFLVDSFRAGCRGFACCEGYRWADIAVTHGGHHRARRH